MSRPEPPLIPIVHLNGRGFNMAYLIDYAIKAGGGMTVTVQPGKDLELDADEAAEVTLAFEEFTRMRRRPRPDEPSVGGAILLRPEPPVGHPACGW